MRLAVAACLIAAAVPAFGDEALDVRSMDEAASPGRPKRFVVPPYPADALAKGIQGYVDVEGVVNPLLQFKEIEYRAGTPEAEVFIPALKEVAPRWELYPAERDPCFPVEKRLGIRVSFAIVEGKPKIDITVAKAQRAARKPFMALHCEQPEYPSGALRAGIAAFVYAKVPINADGTAGAVEAESYPRWRGVDRLFEAAVKRAFAACRYEPAPETAPKRIACYQVFFKLAP